MSRLVPPFEQCVARPDMGDQKFLLIDHLTDVKSFMEQWVRQHPSLYSDEILIQMMGMAGVCHDIAKAHADWQTHIQPYHINNKRNRPHHAPQGAFLFSYVCYLWLKQRGAWSTHSRYWAWISRDLADHHGSLKYLDDDHWQFARDHWNYMDLQGITHFLSQQFPDMPDLSLSMETLEDWEDELHEIKFQMDAHWLDWTEQFADRPQFAMRELHEWRYLTTGLIAGDRFSITETPTTWLSDDDWKNAEKRITNLCEANTCHPLYQVRRDAQQSVMDQLSHNCDHRFYTLEMPTGYGKTFTSLKMATWLGQHQKLRKLVYVAPYLSILDQTSTVIQDALNRPVLEHHSLALWDDHEVNASSRQDQNEQRTPKSQLTMEAWAHDMVCTSFNQFTKALFPRRAQDTLRRAFLQDCVVIIDEPQIFDLSVWNTFLAGLESMAISMNWCVVFLSATMPTFEFGLRENPAVLSVSTARKAERYQIVLEEAMDEHRLADFLLSREETLQGAILNTIEDAYVTYRAVRKKKPDAEVILVHGLMIPIHKQTVINRIKHHLACHRDIPLIVISTQVLEAGVDVSFEHLFRALPILPSIVQAAGRVNRHFEMEDRKGQLTVAPFLRGMQTKTRNIYNESLRQKTDKLFLVKSVWMESEMEALIRRFYEEEFHENNHQTGLTDIHAALNGQWPNLSKLQPFGADPFRLPLFIPWEPAEEDMLFLPERYKLLMKQCSVESTKQLYDRYKDKSYWQGKDRVQWKKFMMLFHHFVLNAPVKAALKHVLQSRYLTSKSVPITENPDLYHPITGFTEHFCGMDELI
ncbi:CRISPR-associated helicase Cas3' [Marinicrinis sediminis]|uniref:CRISPR-associated helicase Cas3 n=1 Tax=Marinicrinis sediminis TaxID=1652465 RepID=A0ABW5R7S2_9BACL